MPANPTRSAILAEHNSTNKATKPNFTSNRQNDAQIRAQAALMSVQTVLGASRTGSIKPDIHCNGQGPIP